MFLTIKSSLVIPLKELQWRFSRSSGPGGQSVNKTDSRVELIFDIEGSSVLIPSQKERLLEKYQSRLIGSCLRVVASDERSQYKNRQLASNRMANLIREGLKPSSKSRRITKPTRASQQRRIDKKKQRGALKQQRQSKPSIND